MRKVSYLIVLCSLLMLPVFAGQATSLETRIGIDSFEPVIRFPG